MKKLNVEFVLKILFIGGVLFFIVNYGVVSGYVKTFANILQPIIIGIVFTLAMSVPLNFYKNKLFSKIKNKKLNEILSISLTVVTFGSLITLLATLIIPQGVKSVQEIISSLNDGTAWKSISNVKILSSFSSYLENLYKEFLTKITEYLPKILAIMQNVFTVLYNVLFGIVISIMLLINRKNVIATLKKALFLIFKNKTNRLLSLSKLGINKFSKYLGGQIIEAFILGFACFITMSLLKVPYSALVSLIIGFSNLIPIFGAYIGGAVCFILVFSTSPTKALVFLIAVIILQQIEGFTTYPIIVGKYVGLNGFWITVSIIIWGGIFGFWGMFLGVPITALLFDIFENLYQKKDTENKIVSVKNNTG